ncbi:hypothetical protein BC629DRAFT_1579844 [Irpex lacteus]|nr:hypothetical protein BC629DRAFT_1579844 [Irpex lacteus]
MLQFPLAPPLLLALGVRILITLLTPDYTPTTADHILQGIWQGILLHYTLRYLGSLVFPVGAAIAGKLLYDFVSTPHDPTKCACALLGVALGVLFTDLLAQLFEDGRINERTSQPTAPTTVQTTSHRVIEREPSKRIRLVSFEHDKDRERRRAARDKGKARERDRQREEEEALAVAAARAKAASPAPTYAHSIDTAITLDSLPSSIDPDNRLTPSEREVALLRARASLADSERRRFKEERKWALSQGNEARASQLEWQFHREADAKLIEAPTHPQTGFTGFPGQPQTGFPGQQQAAVAGPSHTHGAPLVSVTVGGGTSRSRKRSHGAGLGAGAGASGSGLKPAIYVHGRE